jgi:hypothetical protein
LEHYLSDIEEVLPRSLGRGPQQCEVTMPKEKQESKQKRITETKLTGKKARKLSKKKAQIEKLQKIPEGTSQQDTLQNRSFVRISAQRHGSLRHDEAI